MSLDSNYDNSKLIHRLIYHIMNKLLHITFKDIISTNINNGDKNGCREEHNILYDQ